jgi:hypothetical protein
MCLSDYLNGHADSRKLEQVVSSSLALRYGTALKRGAQRDQAAYLTLGDGAEGPRLHLLHHFGNFAILATVHPANGRRIAAKGPFFAQWFGTILPR